jgi:hypothetical protein
MKRFTDMSCDLETYGTAPGFVILEVAFTFFDRHRDRKMNTVTVFPDIGEQQDMGFKIDQKTVEWWGQHPTAYKRQMKADRLPIDQCVQLLHSAWLDNARSSTLVWAKGTHFDFPILRQIMDEPWGFRNIHDLRTLLLCVDEKQAMGISVHNPMPHSGVEDAIAQSKEITKLCSIIGTVR